MKNRDNIVRIDHLIETLNQIRISNEEALAELQELRTELLHTTSESSTRNTASKRTQPSADNKAQTEQSRTTSQNNYTYDRGKYTSNDTPNTHKDNSRNTIEVGDTVRVLNPGLFRDNVGTVTKIGKARISIRLKSGKSTNRKSSNLQVVTVHV